MRTKTFKTFAFFLLMLTTGMHAQNYRKGYVITNEKDTIEGLINYRTDILNAQQCEFKLTEEADKTVYYPGDIIGYRFMPDGKYYISHDVTIDGQTKMVFLEYLVHGTIDLYYYDGEWSVYYFFEKDGQMNMFTKKPDVEEAGRKIKDNKYLGYMKYYFKDYPMAMSAVDKMTFTQASFIDIAQTYHAETCTPGQPCIIYENQHPDERSIQTNFAVYAGVQMATYIASNGHSTVEVPSVQPVIGVRLSAFNPRWSKYLGSQAELAFSRFYATRLQKDSHGVTHKIGIQNMLGYAKFGFECMLPLPKIRPFIAGGVAATIAFADNDKDVPLPRKHYLGGYATIGADYFLKNNRGITLQASMFFNSKRSILSLDEEEGDKLNVIHIVAGYKF